MRLIDPREREINIGYSCVITHRSIVLIGQSNFNGAGRSKHRGNDLARNAFIRSPHAHHSDEVHFDGLLMTGAPAF